MTSLSSGVTSSTSRVSTSRPAKPWTYCKTVEKCVVAHHRCLAPPEEAHDEVVEPPAGPPVIEVKRAANSRAPCSREQPCCCPRVVEPAARRRAADETRHRRCGFAGWQQRIAGVKVGSSSECWRSGGKSGRRGSGWVVVEPFRSGSGCGGSPAAWCGAACGARLELACQAHACAIGPVAAQSPGARGCAACPERGA